MTAAAGQQYGKRAEQMAAQRAIPMGSGPAVTAGPAAPFPAAGPPVAVAPPVMPGQVTPLTADTQRPDEPVTAGVGVGPGPGVEALGQLAAPQDDTALQLRAIYSRFPSEDLRRLIELLDED